MTKKQDKMYSRIDTIQTKEDVSNRERIDLEIKGVEEKFDVKTGKVTTKYNPNNALFNYSNEYSLTTTKKRLEELMQLATVINADNVELNRIDIATDSTINFSENAKMIYILHRCLVAKFKNGKEWTNYDTNDNKLCNVRFKNRDINVEFYDKYKESCGKSLYSSRFEVRFIRVKCKDFIHHIDKSIEIWLGAVNNLEIVEKLETEKLLNSTEFEEVKRKEMAFSKFVNRNHMYIYTLNQLKELYKNSGLKGSFSNWHKDFKKSNKLELVNKTQLDTVVKEVVKSLKAYKKS